MSETDSFIDEVTEEVRRDKLFALFRKYGWIGIALVVVIVGGAAWTEWRKLSARTAAQSFGDAVIAALDGEEPAARAAALDGVAAGSASDAAIRAALTGFLAADEALKAGDRAGALSRLEALASMAGLPDDYRQLAQLKAVILAGPSMEASARDAALAELARPGAPFRALAMEQQAIAHMADGRTEEAITLARQILQEPDATPGLQRRVTQLIVALGGDPEAA